MVNVHLFNTIAKNKQQYFLTLSPFNYTYTYFPFILLQTVRADFRSTCVQIRWLHVKSLVCSHCQLRSPRKLHTSIPILLKTQLPGNVPHGSHHNVTSGPRPAPWRPMAPLLFAEQLHFPCWRSIITASTSAHLWKTFYPSVWQQKEKIATKQGKFATLGAHVHT